jgi:ABC-type amino acid transport substrate-binding protein
MSGGAKCAILRILAASERGRYCPAAMADVPSKPAIAEQLSRRRLLRWTWCAAVAALLPTAPRTRADQLFRTLEPGILRVGTYFVNPPFEFVSGQERIGFEVDLMNEIARRLSLRAVFVDTQWEVILGEMQRNVYDCIVGGITITPERQRSLAWSVPYMTTTLSLVVDAARSPAAMTLADLQNATVGVQAATTDYDAAVAMERAGQIGGVKVYPFAQIADAMKDLAAGHIGAVMKVYPVAAWLARQTPGLRILGQVPDNPQPLGIGFNLDTPGLVAAVNGALADMQRDGTYKAFADHWGVA